MADKVNYITPQGYAAPRPDISSCSEERALVEIINRAAGNGDRSENGDYIHGRKKLREIDRRLSFLSRRIMPPFPAASQPSAAITARFLLAI